MSECELVCSAYARIRFGAYDRREKLSFCAFFCSSVTHLFSSFFLGLPKSRHWFYSVATKSSVQTCANILQAHKRWDTFKNSTQLYSNRMESCWRNQVRVWPLEKWYAEETHFHSETKNIKIFRHSWSAACLQCQILIYCGNISAFHRCDVSITFSSELAKIVVFDGKFITSKIVAWPICEWFFDTMFDAHPKIILRNSFDDRWIVWTFSHSLKCESSNARYFSKYLLFALFRQSGENWIIMTAHWSAHWISRWLNRKTSSVHRHTHRNRALVKRAWLRRENDWQMANSKHQPANISVRVTHIRFEQVKKAGVNDICRFEKYLPIEFVAGFVFFKNCYNW